MRKESLLDDILNAVGRVLARRGLANTTIEAIAAEAGVSKGGVLYYFPSKKDLFLGLIDRYERDFLSRRAAIMETMPEAPNKALKATVRVMLADIEATSDEIPNMATVLDDQELRARVGEFKAKVLKEVIAGLSRQGQAILAMYAIDGLWMDSRIESTIVPRPERDKAVRELLRIVEETA